MHTDITLARANVLVAAHGVTKIDYDEYGNLWWHLGDGSRLHHSGWTDLGPEYWWLDPASTATGGSDPLHCETHDRP